MYVNSGPIDVSKKTPVDSVENNVLFFFQAQIMGCVDYIDATLTDLLSALLNWELSIVLTNRFIVVAD